jgi:hypothetical protein
MRRSKPATQSAPKTCRHCTRPLAIHESGGRCDRCCDREQAAVDAYVASQSASVAS